MIAVEFQGLGKSYTDRQGGTVQALSSFSLQIPQGEFFGLLGHNGAGKTTAIQILAGVYQPTYGDVRVMGESVTKSPNNTKRNLGVVQQELLVDSFFPLPVMLGIQSKLYGIKPDTAWIEFLLEKLMLADHRKKTTRELSGGMKRRMMIARALVHKPSVLVLDEPTAGVDVQLRHSMWEFIKELHKTGLTIILTTHYLQEAESLCSRIGIMRDGQLVALQENQELLALGGRPLCHVVLSAPQGAEPVASLTAWAQVFPQYTVGAEPEGYEDKPGRQHVRISMRMGDKPLEEIGAFLSLLSQWIRDKPFVVEAFYTQQPSLEEVFLKIHGGQIAV